MIPIATFLCTFALAQEPSTDTSMQGWTRKTESENVVSLEIASRKYIAEGKPAIWLIGVVHIGDASYYEEVSDLLDEMDMVLYESVRPSGSRAPAGNTEEERVKSTALSLEFVADTTKKVIEETGNYPDNILEVFIETSVLDSRLASWAEDASVDAWGRPFALQVDEDKNSLTLWSFGSDGKVGGEGSAADMTASRTIEIRDETEIISEEKGMQAEMADIMGLEFQLEGLSYENPTWFCSDLTIGEVEEKFIERGADPAILGTITGEAFTAKIASGMMKIIPMLDLLLGGGVQDTARLLMIEILAMPNTADMMNELDPELNNVIIVDRNSEVLSDIAFAIEEVEDVSSIGVLYGAGHMDDMSKRLCEKFEYSPVEERWFASMSVDPSKSLLSQSDMKRMRFMFEYQMHKMKKLDKKTEDAKD
ncbi:MAG: hypothetical protein HOC27_07150 [Phycisphaerae bacterium]|jgi:hypothetical protein|nr:hypothetical protein [Phycisphaerae bacterium]